MVPKSRFLNAGTLLFIALAAVSGGLTLLLRGSEGVVRAASESVALILAVLPQLAAGLLIGGLARQLIPEEQVARYLGGKSGLAGLCIACLVGALTPGGPFTSFPLVYALFLAGADIGAVVAYISAWSLIGLNRFFVWEVPFLGLDLAALRWVASLPLPIVAGLIARRISTSGLFTVERGER